MKKLAILPCLLWAISAYSQTINSTANMKIDTYPVAHKDAVTDDYFGTKIADPYRWLENDTSQQTKDWVIAENKVTQNYLAQIPFRNSIKERLTQMWNYPKISAPFKVGEYYFYIKNNGLQNQSVWFYKKGIDGQEQVFIDPNTFTADGTAAISFVGFSKDKKYVAYTVSQSGSDWSNIYVMEIATKEQLKDELKWTKFSGAAWQGDGFYYSRYQAPEKGMELSAASTSQKIYFHKLGDAQSMDKLIYEEQNPKLYLSASVTDDERFLIINVSAGTSGNALLCKDLKAKNSSIKPLIKGYANNHGLIDNDGNWILVHTDLNAPNGKVVAIDPAHPEPKNWKSIIPEGKILLSGASTGGGYLWASYLKNASSAIEQYSLVGKKIKEIALPGIGTVSGFGADKADKDFYYSFTNFTTPGTIYHYQIADGKSTLYDKPTLNFNTDDFVTEQVWYPSKDGTKIPMFLVHKKGIKLDGNNPVFLYAYGGFQINLTPSFSVSRMLFLENGGIYAQPSLRGGSEFGEAWHKAGMLQNKQNVFDDFMAAAEFLVKQKYTQASKIAISGGSNGGLLIGACLTQRPDLFRVALPAVGVLDMLRYHKFTVGWGWGVEYGTSDHKEQFDYLIKYSPLHHIQAGLNYPATLITTADHDDRVVPAHSFKFAATMQATYQGKNPILIRIESKAGHGAGKPTSKAIEEATDVWSFVFQNLGMGK